MSVCQNIKTVAEVKRIPIKELSRRVDIPYTTLYNMLNRDNDRFDLHLLEEIARSLDVSVGILMGSAVPNICRTPMKTTRTIPKRTTVFRLIQATKGTAPYANSTS